MKVMSAGCDWLEDARIEDVEYRSNATFLGHDVIVLDISGDALTSGSRGRVYKGAPSLDLTESARLDADIARRRSELAMLLEQGATVVLFLPAPYEWYVDSGDRTYSGTGRSRVTNINVSARKLTSLFPFHVTTQAAESSELELVAGEPFASYWRKVGAHLSTVAFMQEEFGTPVVRIRNTRCVVASIGQVGSGVVITLPQVVADGLSDNHFVDALLELVASVRQDAGDFSLPEWASSLSVGEEPSLLAALATAEENLRAAAVEVDRANTTLTLLQRRKLLVTGTGQALELAVEEAFAAMGLVVTQGAPGRTDRIVHHPALGPAVVEVKGKSKSAAEKDSAQLEKWSAAYLEETGRAAKPVLVVNAWRELPLQQRVEASFPQQMLKYATARGHCLVTGLQLLCAWLEVERDPSQAHSIVGELFDTSGVWARYEDWRSWIHVETITSHGS